MFLGKFEKGVLLFSSHAYKQCNPPFDGCVVGTFFVSSGLLILLHYRGNKKAVTQHSFSVLWYDVQGTPILCNQSPWLGCCNENANTTRL